MAVLLEPSSLDAVCSSLTTICWTQPCRDWVFGGVFNGVVHLPIVDPPPQLARHAEVMVGTEPFLAWIRAVCIESNARQQAWWSSLDHDDEYYTLKDRRRYEINEFIEIIKTQPPDVIDTLYHMFLTPFM